MERGGRRMERGGGRTERGSERNKWREDGRKRTE